MMRRVSPPARARRAGVIVLAGPSGSGKSRLAARLALPVVALDDFYRDGDDPLLPRITQAVAHSLVDWDHPDSWDADRAVSALVTLCATGRADIPVYDIAHDGCVGHRELDLAGLAHVVAEGIFAAEIVPELRRRGLLVAAVCVRHPCLVTFVLRLARDLREHRKAPHVLVTRGWRLMRSEPRIVARMRTLGCEPMSPGRAEQRLRALVGAAAQPRSAA